MDPAVEGARLYRLAPEDFVAARDEVVAAARAAGDPGAAREIAALKRPTRAAWLTNLLVAQAPDEVDGLLALAGPLEQAQRSLDGPALREISGRRSRLLGGLARRAAGLGRDAGHRVDAGLEREVRAVLESALADPALADRVRSGRLVRAERHSGFGPVPGGPDPGEDDGGTVPVRPGPARAPAGSGTGRGRGPGGRPDAATGHAARRGTERDRQHSAERDRQHRAEREEQDRAEREERLRAQRRAAAGERVEQARLAAHDAARERDATRDRRDAAADRRDAAHRRIEDLRAELDRARTAVTGADRDLAAAERDAAAAERRARRAGTEVATAERDLDELDD
ncbi:hypothetical protein [Pseudonocardia sp. HH130630-07]|uniref:hypothetical protein n=1 Tax=Pseudonocardia sp. HH130630-07 TaxID=1690815 RepID=UPI0008152B27|nr:hypothetical protein [Pseudonocardia sp. HH130630-07]ANY09229.1 hypothetical protein AFB00_26630 [Pseudonocardia sp. HH130630-07]